MKTFEDFLDLYSAAPTIEPGSPEAAAFAEAQDDRHEIEITEDEYAVNAAAIAALTEKATSLYQQQGRLVQVINIKEDSQSDGLDWTEGTPAIKSVSNAYLRELLSETCYFYVEDQSGQEGDKQQKHPPKWCVDALYSRGEWPGIRSIKAITETPVLQPDGTVLSVPGWDPATQLLYVPAGGQAPEIPTHPTREDAVAAADHILQLVDDFEFTGEADKSAWLAALLTVIARPAIQGNSPLFVCVAPTAGSGKSLLTDTISTITSGQQMPRMANPKDREEARKAILSLVLAGVTTVSIDNVSGALGNDVLDMVLTGETLRERMLGSNQMATVSLRGLTWFATGNNIRFVGDTFRRVCQIRLQPSVERPDQRDGFKLPHLVQHARDNRMTYVVDALTILTAFILAGRPTVKLSRWGSFEQWSDLVRQSIVWLGRPDPYETVTDIVEEADPSRAAFAMLAENWSAIDPEGHGLSTSEVVKALANPEAPDSQTHKQVKGMREAVHDLAFGKDGKIDCRKLGCIFRKHKGQVFGDRRFQRVDSAGSTRSKKSGLWAFVTLTNQGGCGGYPGVSSPLHLNAPIEETSPLAHLHHEQLHTPAHPHTPHEEEEKVVYCDNCGCKKQSEWAECEMCAGSAVGVFD